MQDPMKIDQCIDPDAPCLVFCDDKIERNIDRAGKLTVMVGKNHDSMVLDVPTTSHISIACDPGHKHDTFGMIIGYVKAVERGPNIEEHLFIGAVLAWEPKEKPLIEVNFRNVTETILKFDKHWFLDKVVFDQWQSILQIQDLQTAGIDAEKIPLKKEDWDLLQALFYTRQIHLLHPMIGGPAAEKVIWELKNLTLKDNGKVDHSAMTSSDLAVCIARIAKALVSPASTEVRAMEQRSFGFGRAVHMNRP